MDENEDHRIIEYFVLAGLTPDADELTAGAQECGCKNVTPQAPVTDVCVIFPSLGEQVPDGFSCIDTTPSGHAADLNHGSIRTNSCYLCYRRGYHKPPLVDIGVLYEGKGERVMVDSSILKTTPYGRPANINNGSQGIYLTYRRALENAPPSMLAVTDICVILTNKGETPPHTFCKVPKNLNRGMVGSMVYLCYKKSQANANRLAHKPNIIQRFPREDIQDFPLPPNVPLFCMPMGAVLESWPQKCQIPAKQYVTFVLTDEHGRKFYGAAVNFYEQVAESSVTAEQREKLGLSATAVAATTVSDEEQQMNKVAAAGTCSDNSSTNDPAEQMTFHVNSAICVVSRYPFFVAFRRFLYHIHRMTVTGSYPLPIERYISHLMYEVPFPTPRRPRVLVQMGVEYISFDACDDSQLPLSGAGFVDALKSLGADNLVYVVLLALLEQKILVHSLRPWLLTSVAEAICSLIFPFHWQCPYIPQCPLDLAGVLHAPLPFIAGVDSRYFELYEDPPKDVTCVDLDTQTISQSDVRKTLKSTILPRKPVKLLKQTLEQLVHRANKEDFSVSTMRRSAEFVPIHVDSEWTRKRRILDTEIQEAFLRFMASLMKGYHQYLTPYSAKRPPCIGSTDTATLFDLDSFVRSRDRSGLDFYRQFHRTQCFIRFIEERSLLSDKNAYNAMFDDCVSKVDPASERPEPKLIELELSANPHTVFIQPPEPARDQNDQEITYTYRRFPRTLDADRFQLDSLVAVPVSKLGTTTAVGRKYSQSYGTVALAVRRTKPEMRLSQRMAERAATQPVRWAKLLLSYAYSLWFVHLPAFFEQSQSKVRTLNLALSTLDRLGDGRLPVIDEVCYRVVMHLCSQNGKPLTAVRVYMKMKARGIQPNAVTLGIYHRAVLDDMNWPSINVLKAESAWARVRNAVRAVSAFKKGAVDARDRRRVALGSTRQPFDSASIGTVQSLERVEETESIGDSLIERQAPTDNGYCSQTTMDSMSTRDPNSVRNFNNSSDLELFEELKNRGTSFVKNQRGYSIESSKALLSPAYDSPAGVLMTTEPSTPISVLDDSVFDRSTTAAKSASLPRPLFCNTDTKPEIADLGSESVCLSAKNEDEGEPTPEVPLSKFGLDEIPEERAGCSPKTDAQVESALDESDALFDPLGVLSPKKEVKPPAPAVGGSGGIAARTSAYVEKQPLLHSPARAAFLEKHERKPFEGEEFEEKAGNGAAGDAPGGFSGALGRGLIKGLNRLQNTPVSKLIKSQTISEGFNTLIGGSGGGDESAKPFNDANGFGVAASPSLTNIVNQASKFKQQMNDAVQKQQPSINKLKVGMNSMMKQTFRSFKDVQAASQFGSPLRMAGGFSGISIGSLDDLDAEDSLLKATIYEDGSDDERYASGDNIPSYKEERAFILSSGRTGCISNFDFRPRILTDDVVAGGSAEVKTDEELIEAAICSCSRCSACSSLNYDEEIMGGWSADESNLNTTCQYCDRPMVPILTVRLRRYGPPPENLEETLMSSAGLNNSFATSQPSFKQSWYSKDPTNPTSTATPSSATPRAAPLGNGERLGSMPSLPTSKRCAVDGSVTPTTVRRGSEDVGGARPDGISRQLFLTPQRPTSKSYDCLSAGGDGRKLSGTSNVCVAETALTVPFLSPLVVKREVENLLSTDQSVMSRPQFMLTNPILYWNLLYMFQRLSVPSHFVDWVAKLQFTNSSSISLLADNTADATQTTATEAARQVIVRCVYDFPKMHEEECSKPLYLLASEVDEREDSSPLVAALQLDRRRAVTRSTMAQIGDALAVSNVHRPIQMLINEHRKRPMSATASPSAALSGGGSATSSPSARGRLPRHCSLYRDLLFFAMLRFGADFQRDEFDAEYAAAFQKLPPKIAAILPKTDLAPGTKARACRKVFMPLDVY